MRVICIVALGLALAGCGGGDASVEASPRDSGEVAESGAAAATATAGPASDAAEPEGTAPPELAGRWRRAYEGNPLFLTLDGNGYSVQTPSEVGAGRIFVEGDQITFSNSNRCDGTGTYTWGFEEGRLRFTLVGEDPCDRVNFLLRATFGRVDP